MYFAPALQHAVLDSFHHALRSDGYLCLGASEMMASRTGRFRTVDLRRRIFAPVSDDL